MAANDVSKLANISTVGAVPIPNIQVPTMPDKLKRIDPDGCAQYESDMKRFFGEWVKTMNVLTAGQNSQIQALVKKG